MSDTFLFLAIGGGALALRLASRHWRQAVLFFMIWILFEGAFRKWAPGMGKAGFFLGHMILACAYLGYLSQRWRQEWRLIPLAPFNIILLALFLWGIVELLNTGELGVQVWLLGMVTYFYFAPLAYLVPEVFPSKEKLIAFLKLLCFAALPLLILGGCQYYAPASSWLNSQARGGKEFLAFAGGHVRISSTFANEGAYTAFLPFLVLVTLFLLSLKRQSLKSTIGFYVILSGTFLTAFMTGSRGAVAFVSIVAALYLLLSGMVSWSTIRHLAPRVAIGGALLLVLFSQTSIGVDVIHSIKTRGTSDIHGRLHKDATFYRLEEKISFMGTGIGSTYQGRQEITHAQVDTAGAHDEVERIFVELGPLGFALAYGLRLVVFWQLWLLFWRLQDQDLKNLALAGCLFVSIMFMGTLVFNYVNNKLFWFVAGFLLLLPRLDKQLTERHL